jgi:hypothetical protein
MPLWSLQGTLETRQSLLPYTLPLAADQRRENLQRPYRVSRFYDNMGNTLDYVYELEGDTLTIWGGEKGSPAYSKGTFSDDGDTLSSEWVYPGGGGYRSTRSR